KPARSRSSVVLPQPEGPRSVKSSPGAISRDTSRSATTSPNRLPTPSMETAPRIATIAGILTSPARRHGRGGAGSGAALVLHGVEAELHVRPARRRELDRELAEHEGHVLHRHLPSASRLRDRGDEGQLEVVGDLRLLRALAEQDDRDLAVLA